MPTEVGVGVGGGGCQGMLAAPRSREREEPVLLGAVWLAWPLTAS